MSSLRYQHTFALAQAAHTAAALISLWLQQAPELRVWTFVGPLGAGKTTLIRHLCQHWGVADEVTSPTFSLINEYHSPQGMIVHADMYRIPHDDTAQALAIGIDGYLDSGQLCLVEWPQHIISLLPQHFVDVRLAQAATADEREISVYW